MSDHMSDALGPESWTLPEIEQACEDAATDQGFEITGMVVDPSHGDNGGGTPLRTSPAAGSSEALVVQAPAVLVSGARGSEKPRKGDNYNFIEKVHIVHTVPRHLLGALKESGPSDLDGLDALKQRMSRGQIKGKEKDGAQAAYELRNSDLVSQLPVHALTVPPGARDQPYTFVYHEARGKKRSQEADDWLVLKSLSGPQSGTLFTCSPDGTTGELKRAIGLQDSELKLATAVYSPVRDLRPTAHAAPGGPPARGGAAGPAAARRGHRCRRCPRTRASRRWRRWRRCRRR